jgi:cellulose synthase A
MVFVLALYLNSGSPRVPGDEEEDGVDDLDNEFNYVQGNGKGLQWQLQGQGDDIDISSSSRHEPHHRIPRLTSGHQV